MKTVTELLWALGTTQRVLTTIIKYPPTDTTAYDKLFALRHNLVKELHSLFISDETE